MFKNSYSDIKSINIIIFNPNVCSVTLKPMFSFIIETNHSIDISQVKKGLMQYNPLHEVVLER